MKTKSEIRKQIQKDQQATKEYFKQAEAKTIRYRVEWKHNGNWRMELNDAGTFETLEGAKAAQESIGYKDLETRIVEVRS